MNELEAAAQIQPVATACVPLLDQLFRPAALAAELADLRAAGVAEATIAMLYPAEYGLHLPAVEKLLTANWVSDWLHHLHPTGQCYLLPEHLRARLGLWRTDGTRAGPLNLDLMYRLNTLQDLIRLAAVPGLVADAAAAGSDSWRPERWQILLAAMQENFTFLAGIAFSRRHPFTYAVASSLPFNLVRRLTQGRMPIRNVHAKNIFGELD